MPAVIIPCAPDCARLPIGIYKWTVREGPEAWSELSRAPESLEVKLCAREAPLIARAYEDGAEVWKDSCLELFIRPEQDARYLNFETNPLGNMIIALGADRYSRVPMLHIKPRLGLRISIAPSDRLWSVSFSIPFALLSEVYGAGTGPRYLCNLYKCGGADDHLGMWREVGTEKPDFHRPEYFGEIEIIG